MQQVTDGFPQHPFVGHHRTGLGHEFEVEVFFAHQGRQIKRNGPDRLCPVHGSEVLLLSHLFHFGQREHLVGQLGGPVDCGSYFFQSVMGGYVAPQCRLHLHLEHRQWGPELVRRITHQSFLVVQQVLQLVHHMVGGHR